MSNSANQLGGKCPYMPYLGRGQMSGGGGTCPTLRVCRGKPIFLVLLQNIDCGYSLEPPRRGGSNVYPQSMF